MPGADDLEAELAALRKGWLSRLNGRLAEIEWTAALFVESADRATVESLRLLLHRLAGTGASFGHPDVSNAARAAENIVRKPFDEERPPTRDEVEALRAAIEVLRAAGRAAIDSAPR